MSYKMESKNAFEDAEQLLLIAENIQKMLKKLENRIIVFRFLEISLVLLLISIVGIFSSRAIGGEWRANSEDFIILLSIISFVVSGGIFFGFLAHENKTAAAIERKALLRVSRLIHDFYDFHSSRGELSPLRQAEIEVRLSRLELKG